MTGTKKKCANFGGKWSNIGSANVLSDNVTQASDGEENLAL